MIVYNLHCKSCDYTFEGWFESSKEFSRQKKKNLISCPSCHNSEVKKGLVAPNLSKKSNSQDRAQKRTMASNINKIRKIVEKNFDYVGDKFSEEAKKIKYGESEERSIYGEATIKQAKELIEEDIEVMPLPFSSKKTN
tara:strand:+ start:30 stop:443 length:414 start_codon:yes stop_codon:yes gene_type:complete